MRSVLKEIIKFEREDVLVHTWGWLVSSAFLLLLIGIIDMFNKFYAGGVVLMAFGLVQLKFAKRYKDEVGKIKHVKFHDEEVKK